MGVDAILMVVTREPISQERLAPAAAALKEMLGQDTVCAERLALIEPNKAEVQWGMRYYGEGYERGDWPTILEAAHLLMKHFPGETVLYGGDHAWEHPELTAERIRELDAHWKRYGNEPYWSVR